jgi:hypothetical protein
MVISEEILSFEVANRHNIWLYTLLAAVPIVPYWQPANWEKVLSQAWSLVADVGGALFLDLEIGFT